MIKYKAMFGEIKAYEIVSETDKTITPERKPGITGVREKKKTCYHSWYETWDEAHAYLVAEAEREVSSICARLERANGKLGQIKGMKP